MKFSNVIQEHVNFRDPGTAYAHPRTMGWHIWSCPSFFLSKCIFDWKMLSHTTESTRWLYESILDGTVIFRPYSPLLPLLHINWWTNKILFLYQAHRSPESHVSWETPLCMVSGFAIPTVHIIAATGEERDYMTWETRLLEAPKATVFITWFLFYPLKDTKYQHQG